jgi:hypothetical protein
VPGGEPENLTADDGTEEWRNRHHRHQGGQHLRRPGTRIEVPHHGAGEDDARAGAYRLEDAPADHLSSTGGQGAACRPNHEEYQSGEDWRASAIAVAEWSPQELAEAEAHKVT